MEIILDFGSGNTCKNNTAYVKMMIDSLAEVDTHKHNVVIKWQLFNNAPPNVPLLPLVFDYAYNYAERKGYKTTASVFGEMSLRLLLQFDIPFVKIACRPDLYYLMGKVPRETPVYASYDGEQAVNLLWNTNTRWMFCVPEYPAPAGKYLMLPSSYISDHSVGLTVYKTILPKIWEKHYVLERDAGNPDGGAFAITPLELSEILR
jgi:sialic acid synthase SpsE